MEKEKLMENLQKLVELGNSKKNTLDMNDINEMFRGVSLSAEDIEKSISTWKRRGSMCFV